VTLSLVRRIHRFVVWKLRSLLIYFLPYKRGRKKKGKEKKKEYKREEKKDCLSYLFISRNEPCPISRWWKIESISSSRCEQSSVRFSVASFAKQSPALKTCQQCRHDAECRLPSALTAPCIFLTNERITRGKEEEGKEVEREEESSGGSASLLSCITCDVRARIRAIMQILH